MASESELPTWAEIEDQAVSVPDELEQVVADALRGIPGLPRPCPHAEGRAVIAALSQAGYSIVRTEKSATGTAPARYNLTAGFP